MTYSSLVLCKISISVIAALGLYLCTTLCGQLSLGSAGFMSIGAYLFAFFGSAVGVAAAPSLIFLIAFGIGLLLLRLSGDALAAATLGIAELVRIVLTNLSVLGGAGGYTLSTRTSWYTAILGAVLVWLFAVTFSKSRLGHLCKAISQDETAALSCGVDTLKLKSLSFALSCAICGFAGSLYAGAVGFICPNDFSFTRSCETLAAVILGGRSPTKTALAAIALELLSTLLVGFSELKMLVYGAVLILCHFRRRRYAEN